MSAAPTAPPKTLLNELLDGKLSTTSVRVTNSAAARTVTTTYPSGAQTKGGK
jgi:predicted phage tail protein